MNHFSIQNISGFLCQLAQMRIEDYTLASVIKVMGDYILKGTIRVIFEDDQFKVDNDPFCDENFLRELLGIMLDYKYTLGLLPYKILPNSGVKVLIPELGTGVFYQIMDNRIRKSKVVYLPEVPGCIGLDKLLEAVEYWGFNVYQWKEHEPLWCSQNFNSNVMRVKNESIELRKLISNAIHADTITSHPPLLLSKGEVRGKPIQDYTESEIYGNGDELDPHDKLTARSDNIRELKIRDYNEKNEDDTKTILFQTGFNTVQKHVFKNNYSNNIYALPSGNSIANPILPTSRPDLLRFKEDYKKIVQDVFGSESDLSGRSKTKENAKAGIETIMSRVSSERKNLSLCFSEIYNAFYRESFIETKVLQEDYDAETEVESESEPKNEQNLNTIEEPGDLLGILTPKFNSIKVNVVFRENPLFFGRMNDFVELAKIGIISTRELTETLRTMFGFERIDFGDTCDEINENSIKDIDRYIKMSKVEKLSDDKSLYKREANEKKEDLLGSESKGGSGRKTDI